MAKEICLQGCEKKLVLDPGCLYWHMWAHHGTGWSLGWEGVGPGASIGDTLTPDLADLTETLISEGSYHQGGPRWHLMQYNLGCQIISPAYNTGYALGKPALRINHKPLLTDIVMRHHKYSSYSFNFQKLIHLHYDLIRKTFYSQPPIKWNRHNLLLIWGNNFSIGNANNVLSLESL